MATSENGSADASTVALFQQDWAIYRKMVDNNFLFHREAYSQLHRLLADEVGRPFGFLDIACGDASASAGALNGTQVVHYRGIDFSAAALELAGENLKGLACPVILEQGDFLDVLAKQPEPVDVAWMGLSLHHLQAPEKLAFMRRMRGSLAEGGLFLIYENTCRDGESRDDWLRRWDLQKPLWAAYSEDEWNTMKAHVHAADFPESHTTWLSLGRDAGFRTVREIFKAPSELFSLYCFAT